jgi:hypothetical protein
MTFGNNPRSDGSYIWQSIQNDISKEGGDATSVVVIRPTRSRFSPGKLIEEEEKRK